MSDMIEHGFLQREREWREMGFSDAWAFLFWAEQRSLTATQDYLNFEFGRMYRMANRGKNNRAQAAQRSSGDGWKGFANIPLSAHDKKAVLEAVYGHNDAHECMREMLATGHKFSFTFDKDRGVCTASATGVGDHCPNKGWTLTAFAKDWTDALLVLAYKHDVIAKGDWTSYQTVKEDADFG